LYLQSGLKLKYDNLNRQMTTLQFGWPNYYG